MISFAAIQRIVAYYLISMAIGAAATAFIASLWLRPYQTLTFIVIFVVGVWLLFVMNKISVFRVVRAVGVLSITFGRLSKDRRRRTR